LSEISDDLCFVKSMFTEAINHDPAITAERLTYLVGFVLLFGLILWISVFDDPISSFDYNYIANYCARLRDFALKHTARQIIILSHNWEFFVQLQTTMNQAGLDPHLSVHVIENCTVVADYSEKIIDLKKDIEAVLAAGGEPSKAKKEEIAGKMRRLIEAVVNTHVFNHQRHQYKQKN